MLTWGMELTEINIIVADLDASHGFYAGLGWSMRPIPTPDGSGTHAWLTLSGPAPVSLHSPEFAGWWDPSGPSATAGSTTFDLTFADLDASTRFLQEAVDLGGDVVVDHRPMPWGQNYAIIRDLDGYRWGLKSPVQDS